MNSELVDRAQGGDETAFHDLVDRHRRELQVHCYRILGSAQDAEEAVQDTFMAAWHSISGFEGRSSVRTWLFRIATNRCLDGLRAARRRPATAFGPPAGVLQPNSAGEVIWLQPYPDVLLEDLGDPTPGPDAQYEAREAISLAFVSALQLLAPRQRAVLVLRDVLGFRSKEVAEMLDSSEDSVASALKHARVNLQRRLPAAADPPPAPNSPVEREIVDRLVRAYQTGDVDAVVSMLTDDIVFTTPLAPGSYEGLDIAGPFLRSVVFRDGRTYRLVTTRANRQPAFGVYVSDPITGVAHANGMLVLTLSGSRIRAMTRFDNSVLSQFGLPRTLPDHG
ncbi:MAG TPA: RNA polymerase subunit sigma-70 [Acidimicrobiales bacterium]